VIFDAYIWCSAIWFHDNSATLTISKWCCDCNTWWLITSCTVLLADGVDCIIDMRFVVWWLIVLTYILALFSIALPIVALYCGEYIMLILRLCLFGGSMLLIVVTLQSTSARWAFLLYQQIQLRNHITRFRYIIQQKASEHTTLYTQCRIHPIQYTIHNTTSISYKWEHTIQNPQYAMHDVVEKC